MPDKLVTASKEIHRQARAHLRDLQGTRAELRQQMKKAEEAIEESRQLLQKWRDAGL